MSFEQKNAEDLFNISLEFLGWQCKIKTEKPETDVPQTFAMVYLLVFNHE